jgi:hypothetical protein
VEEGEKKVTWMEGGGLGAWYGDGRGKGEGGGREKETRHK